MNLNTRLVALGAGLVLMLHVTPSWGQPVCASPGCNPTVSDVNSNTAGGTGALLNVDSGDNGGFVNTAFGFGVLGSNTTGNANTASGSSALNNNTTGSFNTAIGNTALFSNTTGNSNTANGSSALFVNTTGSFNTAIGELALFITSTGTKNTAVGRQALSRSTGNKNIGIGFKAGVNLRNGNNNIYIGNPGAGDESLTIRIGTVQAQTFIAGIVTAGVDGATVQVDDNGQLGIAPSSARYKQDITPMGTRSEKVLDLRPVTFAYKDDGRAITHYGLIAEEVATVYPDLVTRTASGEVQTVKYQELIPMLLNELQRQRQEFQQALQSQQKELAELRALVGQGRGKVVLEGTGE